jgi:hypothetical protein
MQPVFAGCVETLNPKRIEDEDENEDEDEVKQRGASWREPCLFIGGVLAYGA